jgi:protein arginine kinase activator
VMACPASCRGALPECDWMKCDVCGENDATVHLTQMVNGAVKKLHLCEECAEQSGINVSGPLSLTDVLFGMGAQQESDSGGQDKACKRCAMTKADFKKTSRLGCPECYEAFADELAPLLAAMHKGTQHVGKTPSVEIVDAQLSSEIEAMQEKLKEAVVAEQYEEAARLRDLIRQEKKKSRGRTAIRRPSSDGS